MNHGPYHSIVQLLDQVYWLCDRCIGAENVQEPQDKTWTFLPVPVVIRSMLKTTEYGAVKVVSGRLAVKIGGNVGAVLAYILVFPRMTQQKLVRLIRRLVFVSPGLSTELNWPRRPKTFLPRLACV
jgi:hypothetical protein